MNPQTVKLSKVSSIFILFGLTIVFLFWQFSAKAELTEVTEESSKSSDYDIRTDKSETAKKAITELVARSAQNLSTIAQNKKRTSFAEAELRSKVSNLKIEQSEDLQIPEIIATDVWKKTSLLTAPSSEKRAEILRNFLKQNSALFGLSDLQIDNLQTTADYTNPDGNLSFVHFEQKINDVPVFRGEVKAGFSKRGEIIRVVNNLAPNLAYESLSGDFGNAETAVSNAAKSLGLQTNEADLKRTERLANDLKITFERGQFADRTTAEKIYFPIERGVAIAAWRVLLWTKTEAFYVIVDAREGTLLWRKNLTENQTQTATYDVYGNSTSMMKTGDSPSPFTPGCLTPLSCPQPPLVARQSFTLIGNEPPYDFNNSGWIPDGENRTIGNAAQAGIDRDGTQGIDPNGYAFGNPNRNFVYTYNPAPGNPPPGEEPIPTPQTYPPSAFQQGSITNAFYFVNRYHDEMYRLGFTEAARNFQTDNFGRGGTGNDSISVEVQDSSGTNSVNFTTAADGAIGRLQLFIWAPPTPDRDGALDSQSAIHELTHGVSSRLHGNSSGLTTNMSRGMGEGWSDFYALALLSEPTDNSLGTYTVGGYITYQLGGMESNYYYGIRRFPTAIKAAVGPNGLPYDPLTFKHANSNCDTTLGTTSTAVSSAFPRNPVISTSSGVQACDQVHNLGEIWNTTLWEVRNQLIEQHGAAEGNRRALQYITDGMKLAPIGPTMLQERDAIIAAANASDPGDVAAVRTGFAIRGMGFSASIQNAGTGANNTAVTEAFDTTGNATITSGFSVSDSTGDNDGYPEAGEPILLIVPLINNSGTPLTNVTVQANGGAAVAYGNMANGQTVTRNIAFTIPAQVPCGSLYTVTFTISSSAGTKTETRSFLIGAPVGGAPVVFTSTTPVNIPGTGTGPGAADIYPTTINVSGLSGMKKIKVELTNLSATYPGDMDWLLVGPGGQKFVIMSDAVSSASTQTNANVVLKDDAATLLPSVGPANMDGEWKPTDHIGGDTFAPPAPAAPYQSPSTVGSSTFASTFGVNGANLNGTWSLYGVDDVSGDSASISGWKITFESLDFTCCSCPFSRTQITYSPENPVVPVCTCVPPSRAKADFDGDGKTDISVFRPSEGNWYMFSSTAGFGILHWGLSGDLLTPGDFDGDNKTDFAVFRPNADSSQPDFYILKSSDFTYTGLSWGLPGDIPVVDDYDSDNKDDIAIYRPSDHTFYVFGSNGGNVLTFSGISSGVPVAGDFDGDGKADFATYNGDSWFIAKSTLNYAVSFVRWGEVGDKPVSADYDGDGKEDLAVYRPSERTWYILRSTLGVSIIQFGLPDDIPVPGDYDGDGKDDIAVYRDGTWYINRSTAGISILQFGLSSDIPIPNRYLP